MVSVETAGSIAWRLALLTLYSAAFALAGYFAYDIRIYALKNYGYVIHEFDPLFNFRATKARGSPQTIR